MSLLQKHLKRIAGRIRVARIWRFGALGLLIGSAMGAIGVGLDAVRVVEFLPGWGWILAGAGFGLGVIWGWLVGLSELAVAQSVDRRAGLEDRVSAALHKSGTGEFFESELLDDAEQSLGQVDAKKVYPIRFGFHQAAAVTALAVMATAIYVSDSGLLLSPSQKAVKEELKSAKSQVERVAKNLEIGEGAKDKEAEKKLAAELRKFARELERGKLGKEESMQKAQKLAEDAKKLTEQRLEQSAQKMEEIQTKALQRQFEEAGGKPENLKDLALDPAQMEMMRELMEKSGADDLPSDSLDEQMMKALGAENSANEMMRMSEAQRQRLSEEIAKAQQSIKEQLNDQNLTAEQREALEKQAKQMEELMKKLELSDEVKKALAELQNMKEYKELQEMMSKMQQAQDQVQQGEPLTDEQIKELQEQMEAFAEAMKDPEMREQIREQMKEMLEQLKQGNVDMQAMQQMMGMMGMSMGLGMSDGSGSANQGGSYRGEGENQKQDPMELKGKGNVTAVRGERDEERGNDAYTEIKAPTMVGSRTSVPYSSVLPGYKKSAESAVNSNKVKGKHRQRVREYFEQLSGAKGN
jgi:hypothetical protein